MDFSKNDTVQTLSARMGTGGGMSLSYSRLFRQGQFGDFLMDGTASTLLSHLSRDTTDVVVTPKKEVSRDGT